MMKPALLALWTLMHAAPRHLGHAELSDSAKALLARECGLHTDVDISANVLRQLCDEHNVLPYLERPRSERGDARLGRLRG